jgi:hypothetical protein
MLVFSQCKRKLWAAQAEHAHNSHCLSHFRGLALHESTVRLCECSFSRGSSAAADMSAESYEAAAVNGR